MSVFLILAVELVITLILVVPVPRKIRNFLAKEIFKFELGDRLKTPIMFIGIALSLALMESFFTHQRIIARILEEHEAGVASSHHSHDNFYPGLHDRERKYKSERNLYLAGFALTLLFVIGRLAVLLQESVESHEEIDRLEAQTKPGHPAATSTNTSSTPSSHKPTTDEAPNREKSKQEKKAD
jgi:B-cell receptor-associated protein 31